MGDDKAGTYIAYAVVGIAVACLLGVTFSTFTDKSKNYAEYTQGDYKGPVISEGGSRKNKRKPSHKKRKTNKRQTK
jgi:hypothetical protein